MAYKLRKEREKKMILKIQEGNKALVDNMSTVKIHTVVNGWNIPQIKHSRQYHNFTEKDYTNWHMTGT